MIGMRNRVLMVALATAGMSMGYSAPASAQATRTWVSGVGDDVNPCSRTAPCKTFAGAISKTAAGGEINCLDPGGYGAVTIIKSITIDCHYTEGGALAGGNGITVNMPAATDVTLLRGLDVFGVNPPSNGIRFINNGTLHIEDTMIRRFNAANSQGISVAPTGPAKLYINNVTVAENGNAGTGGGIIIAPGVGGSVSAVISNSRVNNNRNNGVRVESTNGAVGLVIDNTTISGSDQGISTSGGASNLRILVDGSNIVHNGFFGIFANIASSVIRVSDTNITGNGTGISAVGGAQIISFLNNRLAGNPTVGAASDGVFTSTTPQN